MFNELKERLSSEDVKWLTGSLLECVGQMSDWDNLVSSLPADIGRNFIQRDVSLNQYVENLVRASIKYRGGVEKILGLVRLRFGRTIAWETLSVSAFLLLTNKRLSAELSEELIGIIDGLDLPGDFYRNIRKIYGKSSGDVVSGYAPSTAYDALLMLFQIPNPGAGIIFVSLLAQEEIKQEGKEALHRWVEKASAVFPSEPREISFTESSSNQLMIHLDQVRAGADEFLLEFWLWEEGRITEHDNSDQPQRLTEIAEMIKNLVSLTRAELTDFTVELVIPRRLFCHDISQWKVTIGAVEFDLLRQIPLVFRCAERFKARRGAMKEGRSRIQLGLAAQLSQSKTQVNLPNWRKKSAALRSAHQSAVEEMIFCIASHDQFDRTRLYEELSPDEKGLCVGFGFAPVISTGITETLSTVIDACGTPVILYFREAPEDHSLDEDTIKALFRDASLAAPEKTKLAELPTRVWKIRKEAMNQQKKDDICYHITLMFDDYDRVPEPGPHLVPQEETR